MSSFCPAVTVNAHQKRNYLVHTEITSVHKHLNLNLINCPQHVERSFIPGFHRIRLLEDTPPARRKPSSEDPNWPEKKIDVIGIMRVQHDYFY